jgi:hypothetical protein
VFNFPFFRIRLVVFVVGFFLIMMVMGMCHSAHAEDGGGSSSSLPNPVLPDEVESPNWTPGAEAGSEGGYPEKITVDNYSFPSMFQNFVEHARTLPIFSNFSFGSPEDAFGDAYFEFDLGEFGGYQEFDFHVWDDSLAVIGSLLVVVTAVICIRIVFLKG